MSNLEKAFVTLVFAASVLSCAWGALGMRADVAERLGNDRYLKGTWQQACTQLLVRRDFRALFSSQGCRNTEIIDGGMALDLLN